MGYPASRKSLAGPGNQQAKRRNFYHAKSTIPIWSHTSRILSYVAVQYEVTKELELEEKVRLATEEYKVLHEVAKALHKTNSMKG